MTASNIAKCDGATTWTALGGGVDSTVYALAVRGGALYAGGSFAKAGGKQVGRVAKWDGWAWSSLGTGVGGAGGYPIVYALAPCGNGIIAGGYFSTAGGASALNVAKWDGSNWSALGSGISGGFDSVYSLATVGNALMVAGDFALAGGKLSGVFAHWQPRVNESSAMMAANPGETAVGDDRFGFYKPAVFTHAGTIVYSDLTMPTTFTLDRAAEIQVGGVRVNGAFTLGPEDMGFGGSGVTLRVEFSEDDAAAYGVEPWDFRAARLYYPADYPANKEAAASALGGAAPVPVRVENGRQIYAITEVYVGDCSTFAAVPRIYARGDVGSLDVTIVPPEAVAAGAKWRRRGTAKWHTSTAPETGVWVGQWPLEFKDTPLWMTPATQMVTVEKGQTTTATAVYRRPSGSLRFTLFPPAVVSAGARWRRIGTTPWLASDVAESSVTVGNYYVEFKDVAGWTRPPNRLMVVQNAQTATANGIYSRQVVSMWGDDHFTTGAVTDGTTAGWIRFGMNTPTLGWPEYSSAEHSYVCQVKPDSSGTHYRDTGVVASQADWLPYSQVGPNRLVRAKYMVYAGGQPDLGNQNQVPNFRLRLSNRFAVNSMLEVFNHEPGDTAEIRALYRDVRPSTLSVLPSVYRVDLDPVDVPYLASNAGFEGIQRGFEAYAIHPTDQGYVAMTESVVGTYPVSLTPTSAAAAKIYAPDAEGAGDLAVYATPAAAELTLTKLVPGTEEGSFGSEDASAPLPTHTPGIWGVMLDTTTVPTDRIGVATRNFNPDRGTNDYATRVRVAEGKQYGVRFHLTSIQQTNQQAQIRLRGRTAKFGWSQKFELGGAWGTGGGGTYPLNANNSIAQQAVPGVGCENPDRATPGEAGGWYTMIVHTPLSIDIRPEWPTGTLITTRMPNLAAQPGPGVNAASRRDLLLGMDLVDTLSAGAGRFLERGNVTLDRIEVRVYDLVAD